MDTDYAQTKEFLDGLKKGYIEYQLTWIENERITSENGEIQAVDGWKRTTYTDICDAEYIFMISMSGEENIEGEFQFCGAWYDENHKFIEELSNQALYESTPVPPATAKYFILSYNQLLVGMMIGRRVSIQEGHGVTASGAFSHAEGISTRASGMAAHAEGKNTLAEGESSHAEGSNTEAKGKYSHASGFCTQTTHSCQYAVGCGNDPQADSLFEVGNGLNAEGNLIDDTTTAFELKTRRNAFRVTNTGYAIAQTALQIGETAITEDQLKQLIQLITNAG